MNKGSTSKTLDNLKWLLALIVFAAAVVGNSYFVEVAFLYRVLGVLFLFIIGLAIINTNFYDRVWCNSCFMFIFLGT